MAVPVARRGSDGADPARAILPENRLSPAPKATRRDWIALSVITLPCMLYSMDLTVPNLAVPAIAAELRPSTAELLWIIDIYGFMVAGFLIPMGHLGDRIGRRRLLLASATAFGAASLLAAFARSTETLIAARALLGIAGATLAPSTSRSSARCSKIRASAPSPSASG